MSPDRKIAAVISVLHRESRALLDNVQDWVRRYGQGKREGCKGIVKAYLGQDLLSINNYLIR